MQQVVVRESGPEIAEHLVSAKKLAIVSTHPIQYHAQWFSALAARPELDLSVFYCYSASPADQAQAGFGVEFDWDIPLFEGYRYTFLNGARKPGNFFAPDPLGIGGMLAREDVDVVPVTRHFRFRRPVEELDGSERGRLDQTASKVEQECQ
jgi:hypothetical protein